MRLFVGSLLVLGLGWAAAVPLFAQETEANPSGESTAPTPPPAASTQPVKPAAPQSRPASAPAASRPAAEPDLKDAREILQRADAATEAVRTIGYTAYYHATGQVAAQSATVAGAVLMSGKNDSGLDLMRIRCTVEMLTSIKRYEIDVGHTADSYFVRDDPAQRIHVGDTPTVLGGIGHNALFLLMREFSRPHPFAEELAATKLDLVGQTDVRDVRCYEIRVTYDDRGKQATWYIGKQDFLPHRVVRVVTVGERNLGSTDLTIGDVEVDPKIETEPFTLEVPEKYVQVDTPHVAK